MKLKFSNTENVLFNGKENIVSCQYWFTKCYDTTKGLKHKEKSISEKIKNKESFAYNVSQKEFFACPDFTQIIEKAEKSNIEFTKISGLVFNDMYIYKGTIDSYIVYTALSKEYVDMLEFPEVLFTTNTTSLMVYKAKDRADKWNILGGLMPIEFNINDLKKEII